MKRIVIILLCFAALIFVVTCGSSSDNQGADKSIPVPETTAQGIPTGAAEKKTIGASGGNIVLSDGRIEIILPAGALSSDTELTVTPITNNAFGGTGAAYRFGPEGLTFSSPVTIKVKASPSDTAKTSMKGLGIAYQDSNGYWNLIQGAEFDSVAETISVKITHFSDYAPVALTLLKPLNKKVRPGETVNLELCSCYPLKEDSTDDWRGFRCDNYSGVIEEALDWSVDSVIGGNLTIGTVSGSIDTAVYKAPMKKPSPDTVNVSARILDSDLPALNQVKVYSQITISDAGDFNGGITIEQDFGGIRFTVKIEDAVLVEKDDGPDETNYTLSGTAVISPVTFTVSGIKYDLAESAGKVYLDDYGFKVLKTDPFKVRWGFIESWEYSYGGSSLPVTINFSTSECGDGDIAVISPDDLSGSYTMPCYLKAGAIWSFRKN